MKYIAPQPWVVCALCLVLSLCGHTSFTDEDRERCEKQYLQTKSQIGKVDKHSTNPGVMFFRMLSLERETASFPLRLKLEESQKEFTQERQTSSLLKTQNEDLIDQLRDLMIRDAYQRAEIEEQRAQAQIFRALYESKKERLVHPDSDEETQVPFERSRSSSPFGDNLSVVSDWDSPFSTTKNTESLSNTTPFMQKTPHKETNSI